MLSVAQSAEILQISPARVRALIRDGLLPAVKVGRAWCLQDEDVWQRAFEHPRPGRPAKEVDSLRSSKEIGTSPDPAFHELYEACKKRLSLCPSTSLLASAHSHEEASFYIAVFNFFLQQRQKELIAEGVF